MEIVVLAVGLDKSRLGEISDISQTLYGHALSRRNQNSFATILSSKPESIVAESTVAKRKFPFSNQSNKLDIAISGYCTAKPNEIRSIINKSFEKNEGSLIRQSSIGGLHSVFAVKDQEVLCWPSIPASGGLYYGKCDHGWIVSNRPRLIACVNGSTLDDTYFKYLITIGFPLDDTTPYSGVKSVRAAEALHIKPNCAKILSRQLKDIGRLSRTDSEAKKADEQFKNELLRAAGVVKKFKAVELRLSGGKDSRILAAALKASGNSLIAHTRGAGKDFTLSQTIAKKVGFKHVQSVSMEPDPDKSILQKTLDVLSLTDGFIETEAHVGLAMPEPILPEQDGVIYGHSHLQKGGMARTMAASKRDVARKQLEEGIVPLFVRPERRLELLHDLEKVVGMFDYKSTLDLLYYPYAVLRAGRYLEPLYLKTASKFTPIYPLNDERFFVACSNLNRGRRTHERTLHDTMETLYPGLADLPLTNDKWRFQGPEFMPPKPPPKPANQDSSRLNAGRAPSEAAEIMQALQGAKIVELAKELIDPEILIICGLKDGELTNKFPRFLNRHRDKLIMRLWFAHVLMTHFDIRQPAAQVELNTEVTAVATPRKLLSSYA